MKLLYLNAGYLSGLNGKKSNYLLQFWRYFFPSKKAWESLNEMIRSVKPDVVALDEMDSGSKLRSKRNLVKLALAQELESAHRTKYRAKSLLSRMPMLKNQCNAVLSKIPLTHLFHDLTNGGHPLVIESKLASDLTLFLVHLALKKSVRVKQIKQLEAMIKGTPGRIIVAGDFNTFSGSRELAPLIKACNLRSANHKSQSTFPAHEPKKELDFVLVCSKTTITQFEILKSTLSDHLPLFIEIA